MLKKIASSLLIILCAGLFGCATAPAPVESGVPVLTKKKLVVYRLKAMDPIVVQLKGLPVGTEVIEDVVDEQGNISLPYIGQVVAAGLTTSELERNIFNAYVDGEIYKSGISVTITAQEKNFFVTGEVRGPGRYPLTSGTTLLQAIASAGGYSPYANQKKIQLNRGSDTYFFNGKLLEQVPEKDPQVEAGDVIRIWRSIL